MSRDVAVVAEVLVNQGVVVAVVAGNKAHHLAVALGDQGDAVVGPVVAFDFGHGSLGDLDTGAPVGMDSPFVVLEQGQEVEEQGAVVGPRRPDVYVLHSDRRGISTV